MNVFVFDIETIPDTHTARKLYDLSETLSDQDVAKILYLQAQQNSGREFLRHHLHQIVAISAVLRTRDQFRVWSLGEAHSTEAELVERFFDGIARFSPTLVSWNGGGFDLPVLHYRALLHGVSAPRYWDQGEDDSTFRYNNYLNRFHHRHTDLMDVISGYQPRASAKLDDIATLLGFPGKLGMDGSKVWETFCAGDIEAIRAYCETDVLNTYLVYLRFELIRGHLIPAAYAEECDRVRGVLANQKQAHLDEFLSAWREASD